MRVTVAITADPTDRLWSFEELISGMGEAALKPGRPKTYNSRLTKKRGEG